MYIWMAVLLKTPRASNDSLSINTELAKFNTRSRIIGCELPLLLDKTPEPEAPASTVAGGRITWFCRRNVSSPPTAQSAELAIALVASDCRALPRGHCLGHSSRFAAPIGTQAPSPTQNAGGPLETIVGTVNEKACCGARYKNKGWWDGLCKPSWRLITQA